MLWFQARIVVNYVFEGQCPMVDVINTRNLLQTNMVWVSEWAQSKSAVCVRRSRKIQATDRDRNVGTSPENSRGNRLLAHEHP